ncbi:hypothetical protein BCR43DRAFT_493904 [Syncephalastrum racemosum]|uniref:Uncharacterized protein n=1 Tax=Syncephalastrum racemosum TaxID=13706 RepID=A0A1X2H729_SYNRA|nr:hypothetical protein BCR43DRAFT_493904 [Syncephalastrum racemosum]
MFVATRKRKSSPPATRSTVKDLKKPVIRDGQPNKRHFSKHCIFLFILVLLLGLGSIGLRACQKRDVCRQAIDEYHATLSQGVPGTWARHFQATRALIQEQAFPWFRHKALFSQNGYIHTIWCNLDDYIHNRHIKKMPTIVKGDSQHDRTAAMEETLRQRVHHWVQDIQNDERRKEMENMAWHMIRQVRQEHLASAAAKISSASPSEHIQSFAAQSGASSTV